MRLGFPQGLRPRLIIAFILVTALSSLLTATLTFRQARGTIVERAQDNAVRDLRQQVSSLAPNLPTKPSGDDLASFVRQLDRAGGPRRWRTAATLAGAPAVGAQDAATASLRRAMRDGSRAYVERSGSESPRLHIVMPVDHTTPQRDPDVVPELIVYAVVPLDGEQADVSALIAAAWAGAAPALLLAVVPALFAARQVLRPVRRLRVAAEKLTSGALETRSAVVGGDELAGLAVTFNTMAATLEKDAAELRRMEAHARRFVADVSHELRTPLAAMVAVTGVLDADARSGGLPPDTAEALRLVSEETRKLAAMVEDLMEISRFDAGAATLASDDADLRTIVGKTLQLRGWEDSSQVACELPESDVRVRVDPRRFDVVLANLVGNGLRHGAPPVTVRAAVTGQALVVEVGDHGPGIPPDVLPYVFDRFHKADSARARSTGSGLGLAIALENVRLHDGSLTAANLPGGGALFTVTLPHARPDGGVS
ncbi:Sensor histidine kinase MtrB [Streptomyces sp. ADI96-02]|uniref:sensor histidine kinase n=1 Tax=Streptomyces sp. ADI96-02 TaxID=1522760 RepID=UPI000F54DFCE|nr:HAMP domain-containing sensor histidine kinase [Streptomyces sp. ADI96-02]RPK54049.1 Sensor histidine kinase MtrB [Streptomyces sp. ADI96-02]